MSKDTKSPKERRREMFGLDNDPLAEFEETLRLLEEEYGDPDPLEAYIDDIQRDAQNNAEGTIGHYQRTFRDWRAHMEEIGRHPACPHRDHVLAFIDNELERGLKPSTVRKKVGRLHNAYQWWQGDQDWPHDMGFDPFQTAMKRRNLKDDAEEHKTKKPPRVPIEEVQDVMADISHILDRAIIGCQLKWGCRSGELSNIRISDIHIDHPDLGKDYPRMGSHDALAGRGNAVLIPAERAGNKRERPTVLPLDEEVRRLLIDWLLVRPDVPDPDHPEDPRVFITHKGNPLNNNDIGYIWQKYWHPQYAFDDNGEYRSVSPHFARHRFSTFWKVEKDANRELVKYMRGDKTDRKLRGSDALEHYLHSYYADVENLYRNEMYRLFV